jgi:hypothetical protein
MEAVAAVVTPVGIVGAGEVELAFGSSFGDALEIHESGVPVAAGDGGRFPDEAKSQRWHRDRFRGAIRGQQGAMTAEWLHFGGGVKLWRRSATFW